MRAPQSRVSKILWEEQPSTVRAGELSVSRSWKEPLSGRRIPRLYLAEVPREEIGVWAPWLREAE